MSCATQTREYPTTGHAAVAPGGWLDAAGTGIVQAAGVDDHGVAEAFELGDQPSGVGFVVAAAGSIGTASIVDSSAIVISRSSTTSFMTCSFLVRGIALRELRAPVWFGFRTS
jgi:hypothetical protein